MRQVWGWWTVVMRWVGQSLTSGEQGLYSMRFAQILKNILAKDELLSCWKKLWRWKDLSKLWSPYGPNDLMETNLSNSNIVRAFLRWPILILRHPQASFTAVSPDPHYFPYPSPTSLSSSSLSPPGDVSPWLNWLKVPTRLDSAINYIHILSDHQSQKSCTLLDCDGLLN